mgnify:CR=1 FL=1|jgi:hypothetical protein
MERRKKTHWQTTFSVWSGCFFLWFCGLAALSVLS